MVRTVSSFTYELLDYTSCSEQFPPIQDARWISYIPTCLSPAGEHNPIQILDIRGVPSEGPLKQIFPIQAQSQTSLT